MPPYKKITLCSFEEKKCINEKCKMFCSENRKTLWRTKTPLFVKIKWNFFLFLCFEKKLSKQNLQ